MSKDTLTSSKQQDVLLEEEFKVELDKAQKWATSVGYTEEDINSIIKEIRNKKE